MTPEPVVTVSFDPARSRLLGMRWMARVGAQGDFGSGRTREAAITAALRIYDRSLCAPERFDQVVNLEMARREVTR